MIVTYAEPSSELLTHEGENSRIRTCVLPCIVPNVLKALVDNREKHAHAHEDHQNHEETETDRTEHGLSVHQLIGIEFHQDHFEEHGHRVRKACTRRQRGDKQQVEERHERHEDNDEHAGEGDQLVTGVLDGFVEERQTPVESAESNEFQRGEETAERREKVEQLVDVDSRLKIDCDVAVRLLKEIADLRRLLVSFDAESNARQGAHDNAQIDPRPEPTEMLELELGQRDQLIDEHVDDEDHEGDGTEQVWH